MGIVGFVGGFAVGVAARSAIDLVKSNEGGKGGVYDVELLKKRFGESVYMDVISMDEVTGWAKEREELLTNGAKIGVIDTNSGAMQSFCKGFEANGADEKYILLAVLVKKEGADKDSIQESLLVNYGELDQSLRNHLAQGNGILTIEG